MKLSGTRSSVNLKQRFDAIGFLKLLSEGEADFRDGKTKSQKDVFNDIESALKEMP